MARQLVTNIWCDVCLSGDDDDASYTPAEEIQPIAIGNKKPRVLALCEPHRKELWDGFETVLLTLGQIAPDAPAAAPSAAVKERGGVFPCPDPDCDRHDRPYSYRSSLTGHVQRIHGKALNELRIALGQEPTLDVEVAAGTESVVETGAEDIGEKMPAVTRTECPECEKVFEWPECGRPSQALGVHRSTVHGIKGEGRKRNRKGGGG